MILVLEGPATPEQLEAMLEDPGTFIKVAVDVQRGILAGGGPLHADCEAALLEGGSRQEDIWGADWVPSIREIRYESFINVRPRQGNASMKVLRPETREEIATVIGRVFGEQ